MLRKETVNELLNEAEISRAAMEKELEEFRKLVGRPCSVEIKSDERIKTLKKVLGYKE